MVSTDELIGLIVTRIGIPLPVYSYDYRMYTIEVPDNPIEGGRGISKMDGCESFRSACIAIIEWHNKEFPNEKIEIA